MTIGRGQAAERPTDKVELEIWRAFFARQFTVLSRRHAPEVAILLRTIADFSRTPVDYANNGRLEDARRATTSLDRLSPSGDAELEAVANVAVLPVWALIRWRENDSQTAAVLLTKALEACQRLAADYGHDYLTARRLHLAGNMARLLISDGRPDAALATGNDLAAVAAGDATRWHFGGAETLVVPLSGDERFAIERQLGKLIHAAGARNERAA